MSVFGDNLKAVRLAKGMTLVQSADALGITNPALSQWEQGKREPKFDMLIELCNLFGTTPNELLGFEPLRVSVSPREIITGNSIANVTITGDNNKISQTVNQPKKKAKK